MEKIKNAKEELLKKTEDCLKQLKKEKEIITKKFDEMIEETEDIKTKQVKISRHYIVSMRAILDRLDSMTKDESQSNTYEHCKNSIESVQEIKDTEKKYLSGVKVFNYREYVMPQQITIGSITKEEFSVNLNLKEISVNRGVNSSTNAHYILSITTRMKKV